jgi:hypothetical protein
MRKIEVDIYDCKADKERPAKNEKVIVRFSDNILTAFYQRYENGMEQWILADLMGVSFNFTDADEWYRPIGGK